MSLPEIASHEEWLEARKQLLAREKEMTHRYDALNADRRRLPMVRIDKPYQFAGPGGEASLLDLFEGRRQLIIQHFMFDPSWDDGCPSCSAAADEMSDGLLSHLHARSTTFAAVSRAPYPRILPFKARMGWTLPWYSSYGGDFNHDFEATLEIDGEPAERPGVSCFLRDRDRVFHTYSTYERGLDGLGSTTSFLDLTALGRQEEWEEPKGRASALGAPAGSVRIRYHDEYED